MHLNKDFWGKEAAGFILLFVIIYSLLWRHAILWLYIAIAAIASAAGYYLYLHGKLKSRAAQKYFLLFSGLIIGICTAEVLLRLLHIGTTYSEQREGVFVNPAERVQKNWYMTWQPHETKLLASGGEYSFSRSTNNEGLSDADWTEQKDTDEIRLMTLGDSFTEGDGAAQDSAYPKVLERLLQKKFPLKKIKVLNAGRIGSDPWFEYKKLHDRLLKYKSDVVLYTNGTNDMFFDHLIYGGMERFSIDSTVKNKIPRHRWLWLYKVSYVFRCMVKFAGYDETLFGVGDREKNKLTAIADSRELSRKFSELAVQHNFICAQLVRPDKFEMEDGAYIFNPSALTDSTGSLPRYYTFDLLKFYKDSLHITSANVNDYFWHADAHHNAKGYEAMAQAVFSYLKPVLIQKIIEPEQKQK